MCLILLLLEWPTTCNLTHKNIFRVGDLVWSPVDQKCETSLPKNVSFWMIASGTSCCNNTYRLCVFGRKERLQPCDCCRCQLSQPPSSSPPPPSPLPPPSFHLLLLPAPTPANILLRVEQVPASEISGSKQNTRATFSGDYKSSRWVCSSGCCSQQLYQRCKPEKVAGARQVHHRSRRSGSLIETLSFMFNVLEMLCLTRQVTHPFSCQGYHHCVSFLISASSVPNPPPSPVPPGVPPMSPPSPVSKPASTISCTANAPPSPPPEVMINNMTATHTWRTHPQSCSLMAVSRYSQQTLRLLCLLELPASQRRIQRVPQHCWN